MPNTNFEMRGNLKEKDSYFIQRTEDLFNKINTVKKGKEFILHDGPPYANGNIHLGHALNKILKDILIRDQLLRDRPVNMKPGWDTHGLPIENQIQKKGLKVFDIGKEKYLLEAKKYALSQVKKQEEQFKKLNLFFNFKEKYLTLSNDYLKAEIEIFHSLLNQGLVYQDLKPVYWSWSSKTALAEAEIEYKKVIDEAIYVKFKFNNLNLIIWTTTPWTLTANVALAFGKNIKYGIYQYENEEIVIADVCKFLLEEKLKTELLRLNDFNIAKYIEQEAINPINLHKSKLVWGHHVTTDSGTGIVHIAGGHGIDDFKIVKENNLELLVVLNSKGHMQNTKKYDDIFYLKANKEIIKDLKQNLLFKSSIKHSVPVDWRTKKPIVFRATKQWFISIKKIEKKLIENIEKVTWLPQWGKEKLIKMTREREDWGISRQRLWGVPIPIIYDKDNAPIINLELQKNIEDLFAEKGKSGWYKKEIKDLLPKNLKYDKEMKREEDILDVWFDSGSSFHALGIKKADVYLEGNDQYRGWFNSSLINSTALNNNPPYKKVITHGMITDGKGQKMSKSLGNTIDPLEIVSKFGGDILRLWVASSNYKDNVHISDEIINQVSLDYRKLRNTIRFMLGTTSDYIKDDNIKISSLILQSIKDDISNSWKKIDNFYLNNDYVNIIKEILNQVYSGSISYLNEYAKDIVYIHSKEWLSRKETQKIIKYGLDFLLFSLAPIIPTTIEEAYLTTNLKETFWFEKYPKIDNIKFGNYSEFEKIKFHSNKIIELLKKTKKINRSQEVELDIFLPENLKHWSKDLHNLLFVAKVNIKEGKLHIIGKKFKGNKCERCWKHFLVLNKENLCDICSKVLKEI